MLKISLREGLVLAIALTALIGILYIVYMPGPTLPSATEEAGSLRMPKEIALSELEDKAGVTLPFDVSMTDQDGNTLTLGEYFQGGDKRPVIFTLGYYGCPMLCSLVLNGLVEGLKGLNFKAGQDYRLMSASIDPREKIDLAKKKQSAYLEAMGIENSDVWRFHVMTEDNAKRLASTIGFNYFYDKKTEEFAHGAGLFVLSPAGVLSRTLFGISFAPSDIKLALSEAADGKIGSFIDRVLLSCFHYDPDSHRYGIYILGVMRLSGIVTVVILALVLLAYFRGERKRAKLEVLG